jgi:hypothetical protein
MTHCLVNHHVTGHLVFILISTEWVMMCLAIDNPTSCEICALMFFLHTLNMRAVEIHRELCVVVYGQNVVNEGTSRQWCRIFRDGQVNKCSRWRMKWSAICSEWWACSKCWQKICERWCFTITELSCEFPQISHIVLYKIITVRLGSHKFCTRWVRRMLTDAHKTENGFGFDF